LRQSDDAAKADHTHRAIPNIEVSMIDKNLFMVYKEKE
jgi:hypothetical protein